MQGPKPMYPGDMNDENISLIFREAGDFIRREIKCGPWTLYAYAIDGLISGGDASEYIFKPLSRISGDVNIRALYNSALHGMVYNCVADACEDLDGVAMKLVNGFCVVLFPTVGAVAYEVKTGEKRSLAAPDLEHTAKGPKDAFVETVRSNTSLVRRHLRTPNLRIYETQIGRRSLTNVSLLWIDGLTSKELVQKMKKRIAQIDIDGMLFPASVEEYLTGSRKTPFPLLQYTERTDRFCNGLLKGRIGLLIDGLPVGYLAPVDVGYLMNSPEDMGKDYVSASWVRILRYGALLLGLLLPAIYVAMSVYHRDLLPDELVKIISESRDHLPYSSAWEVIALLVAFELLQESGIHLPQSIGQSVSIVGGIVVGTTAAEAGLLSPMALIVVSIAAICGFVIPNRDFASAVRVCRFGLTVIAAICGLVGIVFGFAALLMHLLTLRSMGVPYLIIGNPGLIRRRLKMEKFRSKYLNPQDKRNQK